MSFFGDELFRHVFEEFAIGGHEIVTLEQVTGQKKSFHASAEDRQKFADSVDFLLIGGGDLVRPDNPQINYWFPEYMGKPAALFGVGVTQNSGKGPIEDTVKALQRFMQNPDLRLVHVRDIESYNWIRDNIAPSCRLLYSPDIVCALRLSERRAALAPNPIPIFGIITRKTAQLDPNQNQKIRATLAHYKAQGWLTRAILLGTDSTLTDDQADFDRRGIEVDEVILRDSNTVLIDDVIGCDLLASMKFHGCVVGTMSGVPTISWARTDKFRNFYRMIGREELIAPLGGDQTAALLQQGIAPLDPQSLHRVAIEARMALGELRVLLDETARYL